MTCGPGSQVWTHEHDDNKFNEYGWRTGNNEENFNAGVLLGNWYEESRDISKAKLAQKVDSPVGYVFVLF